MQTIFYSSQATYWAYLTSIIDAFTVVDVLEWTGSLIGLLGAYLLATHSRVSRYGWVAFLIANIATIFFAYAISRNGLLIQQIGFMGTSILGMKRAGFFANLIDSRTTAADSRPSTSENGRA